MAASSSGSLTCRPTLPHRKGRAGFLERMLRKKLLHRFLEEFLFAQLIQRGVIVSNERVDALQRSTNRVLAKVIVEGFEIEERDPVQWSGGLVKIIRPGAIRRRTENGDQLEPHEPVKA